MLIDPFKAVRKALSSTKEKIIGLNYDEEPDILYVKFKQTKIVDNKPLGENGMIMASLDNKAEIVGLIVMDASKYQ